MTQKAFLTKENRDFLLSPNYVTGHADFLLYAAADVSLDRTIHALGANVVQERAMLIQQLQLLAEERCRSKVIFPCSPDKGVLQIELAKSNCYSNDAGCGYPCVNQVVKEHREKKGMLSRL
jgi:hypothetical protein